MSSILTDKRTRLFIILSGIFITNALLAEMIGVKLFSAEKVLGMEPANITLFTKDSLSFNLTAGVLLWPVVFITTDIINEYFGKRGVRLISLLTVAFISYAFLAIYLATHLPPAEGWLKANTPDPQGRPFDIDYAYNSVFRQGGAIIIASLIAFLIGQLLDVYVFHQLRRITGKGKIWLRATGSTLVSQLVDSFVVLFVAFYLLGNWPMGLVISAAIMNYIYKFLVAVVLTPLLYVAHGIIDRYLGIANAERLMEEAASDRSLL